MNQFLTIVIIRVLLHLLILVDLLHYIECYVTNQERYGSVAKYSLLDLFPGLRRTVMSERMVSIGKGSPCVSQLKMKPKNVE